MGNGSINERKTREQKKLIIMGDFNSQIGKREEEDELGIGSYYYGKRNM